MKVYLKYLLSLVTCYWYYDTFGVGNEEAKLPEKYSGPGSTKPWVNIIFDGEFLIRKYCSSYP